VIFGSLKLDLKKGRKKWHFFDFVWSFFGQELRKIIQQWMRKCLRPVNRFSGFDHLGTLKRVPNNVAMAMGNSQQPLPWGMVHCHVWFSG
jgi:hypothetical protein